MAVSDIQVCLKIYVPTNLDQFGFDLFKEKDKNVQYFWIKFLTHFFKESLIFR